MVLGSGPEYPTPMRERALRWAPWVLALAAALLLGQRAQQAWASHSLQWANDLAFFSQILFNAGEGRAWASPLLLEPLGFFRMVHFHPVFALILPVWLLRPSPSTLLFLNVAAVCFAAVPLAGLARDRAGSAWFGLAAAVAWLAWLPVQVAALADFRPLVFMVPGFMLLLRGLAKPCRWRLVLGALLVCAAREESGYLLPLVGLVMLALPFGRRRRLDAAILLGIGLAWMGVLLGVKGNIFFHFNPMALFGDLTGGGVASRPLAPDQLRHLGWLLAGGFGTVVLSPAAALIFAAQAAALLVNGNFEWHGFLGPYAHWRDPMLPFIAAGGVMGWAWLLERLGRRKPLQVGALAMVAMILACALAFPKHRERLDDGVWRRNAEAVGSVEVEAIDALLAQVPAEARVMTDYRLVAALAGRRVLWVTAQSYHDGGPPNGWEGPWPVTLDWVDTLLVLEDDPVLDHLDAAWDAVDRGGGYGLWRRVAEPERGYPAPIP